MDSLLIDTDSRRSLASRPPRSLHEAVAQGDADAVRALAAAGANLESVDADGCTPLLAACMRLHERAPIANRSASGAQERLGSAAECALALIDACASTHCADAEGRTPLMFALGAGSPQVARALLDRRADPFARDASWRSCLFYAIGCANARHASTEGAHPAAEGLAALLDAAAPALRSVSSGGAFLARQGSPLDQPDIAGPLGLPPLARAAILKDARSCALLLRAGANPDLPIGAGESPAAGRTPREMARGEATEAFARHFAEQKTAELMRALGVKHFAH